MLVRLLAPLMCALALFVSPALAQNGVGNDQGTPLAGGHNYIHGLIDTVSPSNGQVSVRISVPLPSGRQVSLPFYIAYDSSGMNHGVPYTYQNSFGNLVTGGLSVTPYGGVSGLYNQQGWTYTVPRYSWQQSTVYARPAYPGAQVSPCSYVHNVVFTDPSGGRHMPNLAYVDPYTTQGCQAYANGHVAPSSYLTGSDLQFNAKIDTSDGPRPLMADVKNGDVYSFYPWSTGDLSTSAATAGSIEDRNGNIITLSLTKPLTYTDSANRQLLSIGSFASTQGPDQISVAGVAAPYQVAWGTVTVTNSPPRINFQHLDGAPAGTCGDVTGPTFTSPQNLLPAVQSITLPNGDIYRLDYDQTYGLLKKITYPTGAWVSYTWGVNPLSEISSYGDTISNNPGCLSVYDTYALTDRDVSSDGTNIELHQHFSYQTIMGLYAWTSKQTTETDTDNVSGTTNTTIYTYQPVVGPTDYNDANMYGQRIASSIPLEKTIQYGDVETVTKNWAGLTLPACEVHTYGSMSSGFFNQYGFLYDANSYATYAGPTDVKEFGFGTISPSDCLNYNYTQGIAKQPNRETVTQFHHFSSFPIAPDVPRLLVSPDSVTVNGAANSSTTIYSYDTTSLVAAPGVTSHDEGAFSAPVQGSRGNVTSILRPVASGAVTTTYTYDETGQLMSSADACDKVVCAGMLAGNHTTTYSYADSPAGGNPGGNSNAYLTRITDPVGHTQQFSYNYATGQLANATDQNNNTTNYTYADPLNRLTQIRFPDGGSTIIRYNDAGPSPSVTSTTAASPSPDLVTTSVMDGLGRAVQTQLNSDPYGTVLVDTAYNGMDQVQSVSNPHRSSGSGTDGTTFFSYDALGRKVMQTQPDGSKLQWCYDGIATAGVANCPANASSVQGTWVDSYDEVGNHRQHVSDASGRLVAVMEPDANTNLAAETDYGYDALNNLIRVDEYAAKPGSADAVRQFSYDSLSRLRSALNPETGTTPDTYTYDANGNVSTKTDARGVVIRHCYDTLNRLLSKSSPDQGCPAPAPYATWSYDQASAQVGSASVQIPNGIGRLTSEGSGSTAGSYCGAYTYDAMGRVIRNFFTWSCSGSGQYFIKTAGYNLAGAQNYYENGDWRAFNYDYNGAGQIIALRTAPTYQPTDATPVSGIGYDPAGGAGTINLGNGAQEQISRDNRLRVWMDNLMPSPTTTNAIYGWNATFTTAGNLQHVNDWFVMGNWDYTYDPLNRLSTSVASLPYSGWGGAAGAQTSSNGCQYTYDTFGNRTYMGPYGNGKQCTTLGLSFGGNRIATKAFAFYDAAGNMQFDANSGNTVTYDAEGRVATVSGPEGNASYLYDPEGQRVAANIGGTTKYFAHDFAGHLAWTNYLSGGPEEVWLNGRHFGSVYANPDLSLNRIVYSMVDAVGTERAQFDSNQHLVASFTSNPFGDNQQTTSGSTSDTVRFTGKERDGESGMDYFGARYYSSTIGRFMSPDPSGLAYIDPANPQSLNLYSYALNNPLRMIDPSGLTACFYGGAGDTPENDHDATDYESTATEQECSDNGGTSLEVNASVAVNGNGSGSDLVTLDGGGSSTLIYQGTIAPSIGTISPLSRAKCASMIANDEYSIAAHTTGGLSNDSFVQAALGNSISGLYDLWNSRGVGETATNLFKGGVNPGIPNPQAPAGADGGLGGVLTYAGIKAFMTNMTKASVDEVAGPVGLFKFSYDLASFGYAYVTQCR